MTPPTVTFATAAAAAASTTNSFVAHGDDQKDPSTIIRRWMVNVCISFHLNKWN